jgi:hypothetical protein
MCGDDVSAAVKERGQDNRFTEVDLGEGVVIRVPDTTVVPRLVAEVEAMREAAGLTVDDLLDGLGEVRRQVFRERYPGQMP